MRVHAQLAGCVMLSSLSPRLHYAIRLTTLLKGGCWSSDSRLHKQRVHPSNENFIHALYHHNLYLNTDAVIPLTYATAARSA